MVWRGFPLACQACAIKVETLHVKQLISHSRVFYVMYLKVSGGKPLRDRSQIQTVFPSFLGSETSNVLRTDLLFLCIWCSLKLHQTVILIHQSLKVTQVKSSNIWLFVHSEASSISPMQKADVVLSPLKPSPEPETQVR